MSKDDSASAPRWKDDVQHAVLRVDGGRGFIVVDPHSDAHVVITAAHCLPELPPCHALSDTHERTYEKLLGRLRDDCTVWAECLFADPVADVAVLGEPDHPDLLERQQDYRKLIENKKVHPFKISQVPRSPLTAKSPHEKWSKAWLLSLDNEWFPCEVSRIRIHRCSLMVRNAAKGIHGGMSGSPIVDDNGRAVGIVCVSHGRGTELHTEAFGNPHLASALPGSMLRRR